MARFKNLLDEADAKRNTAANSPKPTKQDEIMAALQPYDEKIRVYLQTIGQRWFPPVTRTSGFLFWKKNETILGYQLRFKVNEYFAIYELRHIDNTDRGLNLFFDLWWANAFTENSWRTSRLKIGSSELTLDTVRLDEKMDDFFAEAYAHGPTYFSPDIDD